MTFSNLLPIVLLITAAAVASPVSNDKSSSAIKIRRSPISLNTAVKMNAAGGPRAIITKDQARLKALYSVGLARSQNASFADATGRQKSQNASSQEVAVPATDNEIIFTAEVGVGTPPTMYQLIVDTGSSNTFVGANTPYQQTSSSEQTGNSVSVSYGSGDFSGKEFNDAVTLGDASITQSIGVASQSHGFNGFDGILGLGPDALTVGSLTNAPATNIPTVTDNLQQQGKVSNALVGITFPPPGGSGDGTGGSLDFGDVDESKFTGELAFVPVTTQPPSSSFWGIDQSITYGDDNTEILKSSAGIVDTGTTLTYLASDAFQAYTKATGATQDETTGLLKVYSPDSLKSLFFKFGDKTFEFTANAQIWPRSLNAVIGGDKDAAYLIIQDLGSPSGQGMDFINGFTFLERFYSVYDTTNNQVGFATNSHTNDATN